MKVVENILILITSFISMEAIAWLAHKYLMHGIGWFLHRDHHTRENKGFFEKNDFFFLIFAIPGILFLALGVYSSMHYLFWAGLGISLYGLAYFTVHDIIIHQRFRLLRNWDFFYVKAIRRAHKMHHKHLDRHNGESFGMLWVPLKYFKEALKTHNH